MSRLNVLNRPTPFASFTASLVLATCGLFFGCGSSAEPVRASTSPSPSVTADSGTVTDGGEETGESDATPKPEIRTLVKGNLLPTAAENLLPNPLFFGSRPSWGNWLTYIDDGSTLLTPTSRILSASPHGVSAPVTILKDSIASRGRAITSLSSFVGGKGPFEVSIWISASDPMDKPTELPAGRNAKVSILTGVASAEVAFDVPRESEQVIEGRTWVHFATKLTKDLPAGGIFVMEFSKFMGSFYATAPSVVPSALIAGTSTRSLRASPLSLGRVVSTSERAAAARYLALPHIRIPAGGSTTRIVNGRPTGPIE